MIKELMHDPIFLTGKSETATKDNLQVAQDLFDTLIAHKDNCVGMAANMIGVRKRIIVFDNEGTYMTMFNPEIIKTSGEDIEEEGCISVGEFRGRVKRPMKVTVSAFDRYGYPFTLKGEKWLARCICHELDHLDGVLFVDKSLDRDEYIRRGNKI